MVPLNIGRVVESIEHLGQAVESARSLLEQKEDVTRNTVLARIVAYEEIVQKERLFATEFWRYTRLGNRAEAFQQLKLIKGLAAMVRDDAQKITLGAERTCGEQKQRMRL